MVSILKVEIYEHKESANPLGN